jgi:hypothetical protein
MKTNKRQKYNGQSREIYNFGNTIHRIHPMYCVPNVVSFSGLSIVFLSFVCLHPVYCVPDVTYNIGNTIHRMKTNKRQKYNGQSRETYNIGNTIHRMKTNKRQKYNGQSRET